MVIVFSTLIIGVVLASTIIGYGLYIEWKNNSFSSSYTSSISKLTAEMLRSDINIYNVKPALGKDELFYGMPFIEGSIKNDTNKTITSVLMDVSFAKADGSVIYKDRFYLIGQGLAGKVPTSGIGRTRNILLPGENISFRHLLRRCPPEIISQFSSKEEFARTKDQIQLNYSIIGVTVL